MWVTLHFVCAFFTVGIWPTWNKIPGNVGKGGVRKRESERDLREEKEERRMTETVRRQRGDNRDMKEEREDDRERMTDDRLREEKEESDRDRVRRQRR